MFGQCLEIWHRELRQQEAQTHLELIFDQVSLENLVGRNFLESRRAGHDMDAVHDVN